MALITQITVDRDAQTANYLSSVGSDTVESISYDNTVNQVTFAARSEIIVSFSDFLIFCNVLNIFQNVIINNFPSIDSFSTTPFSQIIINELHDPGIWNLTVIGHTDPTIIEYEGTHSSEKINMIERAGDKVLNFAEWLYVLQAMNHYKLSIKAF